MIDGLCPAVVCGGLGSVASRTIGTGFVDALTDLAVQSAGWLLVQVVDEATHAVPIALGTEWFTGSFRTMVTVAALLMTPLLLVGTASAALHQDPRRLARTWLVALPAAAVATFAGTQLTQYALAGADELSAVVVAAAPLSSYRAITADAATLPAAAQLCVYGLLLVGTIAVWLELVVRSAAVYVAVFFMPLAMATLVWPSVAHMAKRLLEGLGALILSKFVIVATLALGVSAVQGGRGVNQVTAGVAIMLVAAFAPYVLFRMVAVVESSAIGHLAGLSRQPFRATLSTASQIAGLGSTGASLLHKAVGAAGTRTGGDGSDGGGPPPVQDTRTYATGPGDGRPQGPVIDTTARPADPPDGGSS